MQKRLPIHALVENFLIPYGMELSDLAKRGNINYNELIRLRDGQIPLRPDLAKKLSSFFKNDESYWLSLNN